MTNQELMIADQVLDRLINRGISGEKGDKGEKGEKGEQGDKGEQGEQGEKGGQGERGEKGERGKLGQQGHAGRDGLDGKDGKTGPKGRQGLQGFQGEKGKPGNKGIDGKDGKDGKDGLDGSPDTPVDIKKKLELLTGGERLVASAIKNLPMRGGMIGGSKTNMAFITDLSDNLDGATKTFTIPVNSSIILVVGSSAPFVFRPTTDYTGTGTTSLNFTSAIDAAISLAAGQSLVVIYTV